MTQFDPRAYPPAIATLLIPERLPDLGPGTPNHAAKPGLAALKPDALGPPVRNTDMALACISGLWLLHDFLEESHVISQDLSSTTGSYWHAIMHRREPDASNAKYWFHRVGQHPIFANLAKVAKDLGFSLSADRWSPFDFVDLCEKHRGAGTEQELLLRRVQRREWEMLFDWCYSEAVGRDRGTILG